MRNGGEKGDNKGNWKSEVDGKISKRSPFTRITIMGGKGMARGLTIYGR